MKCAVVLFLVACSAPAVSASTITTAGPLSKVFELMDALVAKINKEGDEEAAAYHEFVEWCDDAASNANNDIKTASSKKEKLEATIKKAVSDAEDASVQIEELAKSISESEKNLKAATGIREKEAADFKAGEGELMDTVDTMGRAIGVLSKEMAKNAAAFAQMDTTNFDKTVQALSAVMDAAAFEGADKEKIMALVQSGSDSDDEELGAPAAATTKSKSGNIVDILEDMKEKAEDQLSSLRKAETEAKQNYGMLKNSVEGQLAADNKDMAEEKATQAGAEETKAVAEGELTTTSKDLASAKEALASATASCLQTAADHEVTMKAREEELKVIAMAKKILQDSNFAQVSLLQVSAGLRTHADLARNEVVVMVKKLADEHHSAALAQLASRISAIAKLGSSGGDDVFAKIKGLITDLIAKLEGEADADAEEKAYCDEQMSKTGAKKDDLEDDVKALSTKMDQATSKSAELKEEVKELQAELAKLSKQQAEFDKVRTSEHAAYVSAKADLEEGLAGVRKALSVLQDYYNNAGAASLLQDGDGMTAMMEQPKMPEKHEKSGGAGQSIISILQVAESDMAKELAAIETEEADSQEEYDKITQENKVEKTTMDQDVKYKQKEDKGLEKSIAEFQEDLDSQNTELSAVNEYFEKVKGRCVAKPVSYEEQKKRREAEIAGLKEALNILGNEAAFVQRKKHGQAKGFLAAHA